MYVCMYVFISGCVGPSLLPAGFLQLRRAGATLRCGVQASHCGGFSFCGARALGHAGISSCGPWAQLLRAMWDLPGPGLKPVSPALAGGFLTTAPPGKPKSLYLLIPFTYFTQSSTLPSSGNHQFVLCIYNSISVYVFVPLFHFFQIPHISEIIWYLSFSV